MLIERCLTNKDVCRPGTLDELEVGFPYDASVGPTIIEGHDPTSSKPLTFQENQRMEEGR